MKITIDEAWPESRRATYSADHSQTAPEPVRALLAIDGVKSIFRAADFIAVDRAPKGDWQLILAAVREALSCGGTAAADSAPGAAALPADAAEQAAPYGEITVRLQTFRGIPLQVRVSAGTEQLRAALPDRFGEAAVTAGTALPNLIKERQLEELGVRYGELREVLDAVVQEVDAAYDDARLAELAAAAMAQAPAGEAAAAPQPRRELPPDEVARQLALPEWKRRYAAFQRLKPEAAQLPLIAKGLADENGSIRRLAVVYLGDVRTPEAMALLYRALEDSAVAVRRTAGDTLSDIGDPAAMPAMIKALTDTSKLVRWRAARFLYEVGDETALSALKAAADEPEFEVRMQINMALERIEGGHAAEGSVWQQMTRRER
jgi:hypothetical protein